MEKLDMIKTSFGIVIIIFCAVIAGAVVLKDQKIEEYRPIALTVRTLGEEPLQLFLKSISTDKNVYYSSEFVNIDLVIYSNSELENVAVKMNGINNRLNEEKLLSLSPGENKVSFSYKLPRCNVCGGIQEGGYPLDCEIIYGDLIINDSIIIEVKQ
ncbi:MAG: hypothetical protein ABH919_02220 [bacterium]